LKFIPVEGNQEQGYTYIHKSSYEYYVQQSYMDEVWKSNGECLDINESNVGNAYLSNDIDILRAIGKNIQYIPNVTKEQVIFPCLYNSILLTRSDKSEKAKVMAANCITVLNVCNQFEFYDIDLSKCEVPKAILSGAVLDKVNFENANLKGV